MQLQDFAFSHLYRVRWADLDPQDVVYNPRYLVFFDNAVTDHMAALGFPYPAGLSVADADLMAVHTEITYRASARMSDELRVGARVGRIGRTSLRYLFGIWRDDRLLVEGAIDYVCVGLDERRPQPLPQRFVDSILAFEAITPERKVLVPA